MPRRHGRELPDARNTGFHEQVLFDSAPCYKGCVEPGAKVVHLIPSKKIKTGSKAETGESAVRFDPFRMALRAEKKNVVT